MNIELSGIEMQETQPRTLTKDPSVCYNLLQEDDIECTQGTIHVAVQGDRSKPAIITYHDIGMNHITCFQGFFNFSEMQPILRHFCVYHINAPGQQEGAVPLTNTDGKRDERASLLSDTARTPPTREENKKTGYPTMDQLAEMLVPVLKFYELRSIIGFGVGFGANILSRFALSHPELIDALFLINCSSTTASWSEWAYQKLNTFSLRSGNISTSTESYLLWHWFGKEYQEKNYDLVHVYKENIKAINPHNLAMLIDAYINRTDLGIAREMDPTQKKQQTKTIKCNTMLVVGAGSPHLDDVVYMNGRLDPKNSNWMKISDCSGMVLEEQPAKVCEAFRLFLQGMGYVPSLSQSKHVAARQLANQSSILENIPPALPTPATAMC